MWGPCDELMERLLISQDLKVFDPLVFLENGKAQILLALISSPYGRGPRVWAGGFGDPYELMSPVGFPEPTAAIGGADELPPWGHCTSR